jgi:helix-turn-helix protein
MEEALLMELLTMTQLELTRLAALQRLEAGELTQAEIARQLQISIRQVKRLWRRYRHEGTGGVNSRRRGQPSNNRTDPALLARAVELYRNHYADFGPTFASEKLLERHSLRIDHEVLRRGLIAAQIWSPSKRRRKTHPPRDRRPAFGELAQIDGSPHDWFEDRGPRCTLLVGVDDATSRLLALHFAPQETTDAYFMLVRQHVRSHGVPLAYYTDKDSVFYLTNPQSADHPTQFGRAMIELGVHLICAHSPQAKGRVERANGVLQNRLVKELRLHEISTIDEANLFLPEFIRNYNAKFAKEPKCAADLHRPAPTLPELDRILTHCEQRRISKNLTIQFGSDVFEILLPDQARRLAHTNVHVRRLQNGRIVLERNGQALPFRVLATRTAMPKVVGAKAIAQIPIASSRRPDHQEKAHTPATTHPWRRYSRRPPQGDTSTEFAGDITA